MGTRASSRDDSQSPSTYFRRVHAFWSVWFAIFMLCASWAVFMPTTIPHEHLGYLGIFSKYVVEKHHTFLKTCYWLTIVTHLMEGLYALRLCKEKGITGASTQLRWFVQTVCLGGFSLFLLWRYKPQKKKQ